MRSNTRLIRSLLTSAQDGQPLHAGPVFAAPFHVAGEPNASVYSYSRSHNPTWTALEHTLGLLESGDDEPADVRVFSSGMTAIAAVFGSFLRAGDAVVLASDSYYTARLLLQEHWAPLGVELRLVPNAELNQPERLTELLRNARLLWLETPANPTLAIIDLEQAARCAHSAGAIVAVDNTTATPLGQNVLALGADLAVVSDTKLMTGHSDLLLGHVASRAPALMGPVDRWRTLHGGGPGPMEAWLAHRSLATLPVRLERCCSNAQRIAEHLSQQPAVRTVLYPGLPSHPGHALAARQMTSYGPVVSFVLDSRAASERFLARARLITEATSFGGISTTAERRGRWGHDAIPEGMIRLSAGLEDSEDLLDDLTQALEGLQ